MSEGESITDRACAAIARHPRLTLLLDLDGTLIPFAPTPEQASLDSFAVRVLDACSRCGIGIVILSGRPKSSLEPLCEQVPNAWWVAEDGAWYRDDRWVWRSTSVATELGELGEELERLEQIPGMRIERKSASIAFHWRQVPPVARLDAIVQTTRMCDGWLRRHPDFDRLDGPEMMEVRKRSVHKGVAVTQLRRRMPGAKFVAIGDDESDDHMFAALRADELSINVGPRTSRQSTCTLPGPTAVRAFLRWLLEARTSARPRSFTSLTWHRVPFL